MLGTPSALYSSSSFRPNTCAVPGFTGRYVRHLLLNERLSCLFAVVYQFPLTPSWAQYPSRPPRACLDSGRINSSLAWVNSIQPNDRAYSGWDEVQLLLPLTYHRVSPLSSHRCRCPVTFLSNTNGMVSPWYQGTRCRHFPFAGLAYWLCFLRRYQYQCNHLETEHHHPFDAWSMPRSAILKKKVSIDSSIALTRTTLLCPQRSQSRKRFCFELGIFQ